MSTDGFQFLYIFFIFITELKYNTKAKTRPLNAAKCVTKTSYMQVAAIVKVIHFFKTVSIQISILIKFTWYSFE